jgi:hypothetical protein
MLACAPAARQVSSGAEAVMPRLVIRKGEGQGKDHALSGACVVGRHASAQFVLGDPLVSRNHFRVVHEDAGWKIYDLGSRNGTRVNGERITNRPLADGDKIVVGTTEIEFVQKDLLAVGAKPAAARPSAPAPVPDPAAAAPTTGATTVVPKPKIQAPVPTKKRL